MRKGLAVWPLAAEIWMDCGNVVLVALNFSLIHCLKLTNCLFIYAHLNPFKGGKPLINKVISNWVFAEILYLQETWLLKVLNLCIS